MPEEIDMAADPTHQRNHKIGEVAELLGMTTRTLRFYEQEGMLSPSRTVKGTRRYSDQDIARLRVIQHLVSLGVSLRRINDLAAARPGSRSGDEASHKVVSLLNDLLIQVENKIRQAEDARQQIGIALQLVEQCFGCRNRPTFQGCKDCPVEAQREKSRLFHLIWDQQHGE